jgi:hypothetical protein
MTNLGTLRPRVGRWIRLRSLQLIDVAFRMRGRGRTQHVLVECDNSLMAAYAMRLYATIAGRDTLRGRITAFAGRTERHEARAAELGLEWISPLAARFRPWDLVVMANHVPLRYARSIPKVVVSHGPDHNRDIRRSGALTTGAPQVRTGSYFYDRQRILWPDGQPVYSLMLESSERSAAEGVRLVPELAGRIEVIGDLLADDLVARHLASRPTAGADGSAPTRVAVMSTWGPNGLVEKHSSWVFPLVRELAASGEFTFVITMHNNLWDAERSGTTVWREELLSLAGPGVRVVRPDEDWSELLPQTDVAIGDHTSLSATYSSLGQPMIPVAVPHELLNPGTFCAWWYEHRAEVSSAEELRAALHRLDHYTLDGAPQVIDHVGESQERARAALDRVLLNTQ